MAGIRPIGHGCCHYLLYCPARRMEIPTVHYTRSEGAQRQAASQRQRLGETEFYRKMAAIRRHKDTPAEPSGE